MAKRFPGWAHCASSSLVYVLVSKTRRERNVEWSGDMMKDSFDRLNRVMLIFETFKFRLMVGKEKPHPKAKFLIHHRGQGTEYFQANTWWLVHQFQLQACA